MTKYYRLTLFSFLFFCSFLLISSALADNKQSLPVFLEKIRENASHVQSFSCNFTQERHLSLFPEPVIFQGNLKLVRPDRLRWAFVHPIPSVLIFNGKKGIRCSDNQQPVHFDLATDPIMRVVAEQLWGWLNNDYDELQKQYTIEPLGESSLTIIPSDQSTAEFIGSVIITFDPDNSHPQKVVITEPGGDSTRIEFTDYRFNTLIPQSTFTTCHQRD